MKYWILVTHPKNFELMKTKNIGKDFQNDRKKWL